ncbi:hypothetical protein QCA50_019753 [Cerrena zonata]|uniref:F-box domain-containing protein n=1 Tax=Cerrena zonata TaxID=2478898 RepID=A0AAW0FDK2_9APHY
MMVDRFPLFVHCDRDIALLISRTSFTAAQTPLYIPVAGVNASLFRSFPPLRSTFSQSKFSCQLQTTSPTEDMAFITDFEHDQTACSSSLPPDDSDADSLSSYTESDSIVSASREQVPSQAAFSRKSPRIPLELHKEVIDWVATYTNFKISVKAQRTLLSCMLVCKNWYPLAYKHLYNQICVREQTLPGLKASLTNNPALAQSIRLLQIDIPPGFFISYLLHSWNPRNLECLQLWFLDIHAEPTSLCKIAAQVKNVHSLELVEMRGCTTAELIKFVNLFPSLSKLELRPTELDTSKENSQLLPRAWRLATPSLTNLIVALIPGISTILNWFIKADLLAASLKKLTLDFGYSTENLDPIYGKVAAFLTHCSNTLVELTLIFDDPGMILEHVSLSGLPKLSKLVYRMLNDTSDYVLVDLAVKQLQEVPSTNAITEIVFDLDFATEEDSDADYWMELDSLLVGGTFKQLHKVAISSTYLEYLPQLDNAGLLTAYMQIWPW